MSFPHLCGICGKAKQERTYNVAPHGVKMQTVRLCAGCDLQPDTVKK